MVIFREEIQCLKNKIGNFVENIFLYSQQNFYLKLVRKINK